MDSTTPNNGLTLEQIQKMGGVPVVNSQTANQISQPQGQGLTLEKLQAMGAKPVQQDQGFFNNAVDSAGNLVGGLANGVLHPIKTVENLGNAAAGGLEEGANALGVGNFNNGQTQNFDTLKNFYNERYGISDLLTGNVNGFLQKSAKTFYTDPAGAAADLSLLLEGGGGLLSKLGDISKASDAADMADYVNNISKNVKSGNAIPEPSSAGRILSKTGGTLQDAAGNINPFNAITKPISALANSEFAGNVVKGGFSQLTGIQPNDIETIAKYPDEFHPDAIESYNRSANAEEIGKALDKRVSDLEETGSSYNGIRSGETPVVVDANFLREQIEKMAGVSINEDKLGPGGYVSIPGKIDATGSSLIRETKDVRALQSLYDRWQPYFQYGELSPSEFLNFRTDLSNVSKFERDIGKSTPLESLAQRLRGELNTNYRKQIPGLEDVDATFASQATELKQLRKGLLNKDGMINPNAANRIANSLGKGKDGFLSQLEDISPGITKKIAIGKAMESIQALKGNVVGTYGRTAGAVGAAAAGLTSGGPLGAIASAIAEQIVTSPSVSVPLLRAIGKGTPLYDAIISKINLSKPALVISQVGNLEKNKNDIKVKLPVKKDLRVTIKK